MKTKPTPNNSKSKEKSLQKATNVAKNTATSANSCERGIKLWEHVKQYKGKVILPIPANYKHSIDKGWNKPPFNTKDKSYWQAHNGNAIWVLGKSDFVIDVDVKDNKNGRESYRRLIKDYKWLKDVPITVVTPSTGYHLSLIHI